MKIAIVTDAWHPQVNGVVRTLDTTGQHLRHLGHEVLFVSPEDFRTVPCPTYPQIRLAVFPRTGVGRRLSAFAPDAIHIATEGPLGHAAHHYCRKRKLPFTTSFHTQFPEYVRLRAPIPTAWSYAYLRRFHSKAARTFVPTESQHNLLQRWGFQNLRIWSRGVDSKVFNPEDPVDYGLPKPVMMYMGRVAVEKNIEAFLDVDATGSKVVVGDGPDFDKLVGRYSDVTFVGAKFGRELARHVAGGDVFVFPSRTDTFGLVLLEAMACGLPVAAFPVIGPRDVIEHGVSGVLDEDLGSAIQGALRLPRNAAIAHARNYSWDSCTNTFFDNLAPIGSVAAA